MATGKQKRLYTLAKSRKNAAEKAKTAKTVQPFESKNKVIPLYLLMAVVPDGQQRFVGDLLYKSEVPAATIFSFRASGTASTDMREVLGLENIHKRLITSVIREDTFLQIAPKLDAKFKTSQYSAGIAFLIPLTGVYGLSAYKMLARYPVELSPIDPKLEETYMNAEKEAIIAIVNDGYSDLVMEAAKAAGATGGTIIRARGSGSKEAESFYGVVVTPEKETVITIVDRDIKDAVLESIGKECGLQTKGQGICFSIPVSGSVGLGGHAPQEGEGGDEGQPE